MRGLIAPHPLLARLPTEHEEQVAFVREFRLRWPDVLIFAIPNGEKRSKAAAGRLKAEGVVAGMPDLCVPEWGLWVEMKRLKGGRLSPEQSQMRAYLREACGATVIVGRGAADAMAQVMGFINDNENSDANQKGLNQ